MKSTIRKVGALGVFAGMLAGMLFGAGITVRDAGAHENLTNSDIEPQRVSETSPNHRHRYIRLPWLAHERRRGIRFERAPGREIDTAIVSWDREGHYHTNFVLRYARPTRYLLIIDTSAPEQSGGCMYDLYGRGLFSATELQTALSNCVQSKSIPLGTSNSETISGLVSGTVHYASLWMLMTPDFSFPRENASGWEQHCCSVRSHSLETLLELEDHGDTRDTATAINVPSTTSASINRNHDTDMDADFFRFVLPSTGDLDVFTTDHTNTHGALYRGSSLITYTRGGSNFHISRTQAEPGTYYIRVLGDTGYYTLNIEFTPTNPPDPTDPEPPSDGDDHGNTPATATAIPESSTIAGNIESDGDLDYFRIEHSRAGLLRVRTTGGTDTFGTLFQGDESIATNDDGGDSTNFLISRPNAPAGTYYVEVRGFSDDTTGAYELDVVFESGQNEPESNTQTLPLVLPVTEGGTRESFVRIINNSGDAGTVSVHGIDDAGERYGPVSVNLPANGAVHFRSRDLEQGNAERGITTGIGDGEGNWRLEFESSLDFEAFAYIRTSDGFLTSMYDTVPVPRGTYRVVFFNPASNLSKQSRLRLVNPGTTAAEVTISARDDAGVCATGGLVTLTLPAGASQTLTAQELEAGAEGFTGSFGDGAGKWRLFVTSSAPIEVMSLLSTASGHLANLSTVPFVAAADNCRGTSSP